MLALERRQLVPAHGPAPDPAAQLVDRARRLRFEQDLAAVDDRHAAAQLLDVLDDVRREDDDAVLADLAQQVQEADALGRVEPRGRLVDDDQLRVAEQRDGDAEALPHAAGERAELLLAHLPQVGPPEQRLDDVAPRPGSAMPFSTAKCSSSRSALTFGWKPNDCGR